MMPSLFCQSTISACNARLHYTFTVAELQDQQMCLSGFYSRAVLPCATPSPCREVSSGSEYFSHFLRIQLLVIAVPIQPFKLARKQKHGHQAVSKNDEEEALGHLNQSDANPGTDEQRDDVNEKTASKKQSSAKKAREERPKQNNADEKKSHSDRPTNFEDLQGIGEHSDDSESDTPLEAVALSDLPSQKISLVRNDEAALSKKLSDIAMFQGSHALPFTESLEITMPLSEKLPDQLAMDDIKREHRFAELTTASVHLGLDRLRKSSIKFRRPDDYFAEMVKSDHQMAKVKARIMHQKESIEAAEKRRNNREITKNRKKIRGKQLEQQQEKKRKAKEEIEAFSYLRKQRVKERANGNHSDDDNEFPIDLLDVEQLDSENRFQKHADISSGKKKAWRPDTKKGKNNKKGKAKRPGKDARKKNRAAGLGSQKFGKAGGDQRRRKLAASGGIKKRER